jgi:hypothetical protein
MASYRNAKTENIRLYWIAYISELLFRFHAKLSVFGTEIVMGCSINFVHLARGFDVIPTPFLVQRKS